MVATALVSLTQVHDARPSSRRVVASGAADVPSLGLDRAGSDARASRSDTALVPPDAPSPTETTAEVTTTTAVATTTAAPTTTARPTITTARAARATTTTVRATTTTVRATATTARPATTTTTAPRSTQEGDASYYDTASPEQCAHRSIPFGTVVKVIDLSNGRSTTCVVRDRGPFVDGRIIDLSSDRFAQLEPTSVGVIHVRIEW